MVPTEEVVQLEECSLSDYAKSSELRKTLKIFVSEKTRVS